MNSFDDENTSPNFPQKSLPQKTMELAKLPRQALRALQAHSDPSATSSAQECSSARVIQLATSYSNSAGDTKPGSSIELPHSITVNGLSKSIGALKDIARLGSSFGQVLSVKFIEPTTALIIFLTIKGQQSMLGYFSTQNFHLCGQSIEVLPGPTQAVDIEPWLLSAARQGRTRTVAVAFRQKIDEFQVRNMFSQYCEVLDVIVLGAQAVVEADTVSGAIFAATMLNRPSISCVSIDDTALEANFAESNCIEQTNEADDSYKSALKSNLDATYVGSSEHSSRNEQSCERHNLNDWEKIKIVKAKYAVDPENVLHVSNYGPGTTPDELLAVFEPVVKVDEVVMKNGYAFINCSSRDYAIAGKAFADTGQLALVVNGSLIRVRYSPNRPHSAVLDENSPTCGPQIEPTKNLYVCGLPPQVTQEALGELFSSYCRIKKVVLKHSNSFEFCFVNTMSVDDATEAMQALDGTLFCGHRLKVRFAKDFYKRKSVLDHESGFGSQNLADKSRAPKDFMPEVKSPANSAQPENFDVVDDGSTAEGVKKYYDNDNNDDAEDCDDDDDDEYDDGDGDDENSDVRAEDGAYGCKYHDRWINPPSSSIHVTNIADITTAKDLKQLFQRYCPITSLSLKDRNAKYPRHNISSQRTARCKLYAFVNTPSVEDATCALNLLQGHFLNGVSLHLSYAREYSSARHRQSVYAISREEVNEKNQPSTDLPRPPPIPHPSDMMFSHPSLDDPRLFARVLANGQVLYGDADCFANFCAVSGLETAFVPPPALYGYY